MADPSNKRRFPRAHVEIALEAPRPGATLPPDRITNVSLGGALVLTAGPPPEGGEIELNFTLPDGGRTISLCAQVLRYYAHGEKTALAVRFGHVRLEDQVALGTFVSQQIWAEGGDGLPEAPIIDDERAEGEIGEKTDPAGEPGWSRKGIVVVAKDHAPQVPNLARELGGGIIVVDTKK